MNVSDFVLLNNTTKTKICHYTSIANAREIISGGAFYLNKLSKMNDQSEAEMHGTEAENVYATSFCHSESKSIPLFYLYSGIDGKGCRLEFTLAKMKQIVSGRVFPVNKKLKILKNEIDKNLYDIQIGWIHYVARDGAEFYKGKKLHRFNDIKEAYQQLKSENEEYLIKRPYWRYEDEFRICVRFKSKIQYDRIALKFDMNEIEKGISMECGPELSESELEEIKKEFADYGIRRVSRFNDIKIQMGLVEKNKTLLGIK